MDTSKIKVGDRITFRVVTRYSAAKMTRMVNGFFHGSVTVRAHGWPEFIVHPHEIISIQPKEQ